MAELRPTSARNWPSPTASWSSTPAPSPRRGPSPAASPASGAAGWARSTTARSASSWPTPPTAGYAPLDRRLYLPEDWADDEARREKCHVPPEVKFQEKWRIALDLLDRSLPGLPHGWIVGDDEFGRAAEFRAALRQRAERYVLDVPCNTTVRDLERRRPPPQDRPGVGRKREVPFVRADAWAATPAGVAVGADHGPRRREGAAGGRCDERCGSGPSRTGRIGPEERLVVIRPVGESRIDYALTNAGPEVPLAEVVRAQRQRHRIEEVFGAGNGEAGLDHYEVRSWVGWHHHMTLSLVALWFLCLERRRVGGENPGDHGAADAADLHAAAPRSGRRARRRSPRWSRVCCGVTRSRGSTTGTRERAAFPPRRSQADSS